MEIVVGVEGSEEGNIEDSAADKPVSGSPPVKQVADPVVYKLVRVDFDGRLVPATDDELMEVENLLELDKSEMLPLSDVLENVKQGLDKDDTPEKPLLETYKGSLKVKNAEVDEEKLKSQLEETLPTSASSLNDGHVDQSENTGHDSSLQDRSNKSGSGGLKPNFSWLKGEINLNKLTTRELHETFRATFGRETSVKDKMWLKRRIAMGLTNSCDVSVTSFIVKDGKFFEKKEEIHTNMDCEDSVAGGVCSSRDDMPVACQNLMEDSVNDGVELRQSVAESGCRSDDAHEQSAVKRVRKPTKRYIEELSDKETKDCLVKSTSSAKRFGEDKASSRSPVMPGRSVHTGGAIVTRSESIGGSGIQVPYVSRVRRCRPRKSVMALTKLQPSDVAVASKASETSVAVADDVSSGNIVLEVKTVPSEEPNLGTCIKNQNVGRIQDCEERTALVPITSSPKFVSSELASEDGREKQCLTSNSDSSQDREPKDANTSRDNTAGMKLDGNIPTVPTAKGGVRRKHHRAWSLTEVVKLVDGVAKFGAGRWSEIKRLSFSSQAYRTSVDLKDKWRNLLKASYASSPSDKGIIPRKNAPSPIPAPILVKVRELAEINDQVPIYWMSKARTDTNSGSSVNEEDRSGGYL